MKSFYLQGFIFAIVLLGSVLFSQAQLAQPEVVAESPARVTMASAEAAKPADSSLIDQARSPAGQFYDLKSESQPAPLPEIQAVSFIVKELGSSVVLAQRNGAAQWPSASITKLMTAVVALERLDPVAIIAFSSTTLAVEGTAGNFSEGEKFVAWDLVRAMLTVSSNKAAAALAEHYGTETFVAAMQQKANELNMLQTTFADPTGLSVVNQSTPYDLERLLRFIARQHPEILEASRQREIEIVELRSTIKRRLVSINQFAGTSDFIGGKTGFTDEASGNLVSVFKISGREFYIGIFGTNDRFGATAKLLEWLKVYLK